MLLDEALAPVAVPPSTAAPHWRQKIDFADLMCVANYEQLDSYGTQFSTFHALTNLQLSPGQSRLPGVGPFANASSQPHMERLPNSSGEKQGRRHHFKIVTYLKMGCPLSTEQVPLIISSQTPHPHCHESVQRVLAKLIADRPDYVFTTTTRPRNGAVGDVMPESYVGIWDLLSSNNIGILGMRETPWLPATADSSTSPTVWPAVATLSPAAEAVRCPR
jgi:hypothetical protein